MSKRGTIYGTGSLLSDDRGVGEELRADLDLNPTGFVSVMRVHHDHRDRKFGSYQCLMLDLITQQHVNSTGIAEDWYLFTDTPKMVHICTSLGWLLVFENYPVKVYNGSHEDIYWKQYMPITSSP
jgi:hypothetical protein